jgi:outer membrane receptor protein involved in Fe transport
VHVGQFYYDAGNLGAERYELAHFRCGIAARNWRVDGWMRNAFDERYIPVAFQPNPADPSSFVGESAAPRTYGVSVALTF